MDAMLVLFKQTGVVSVPSLKVRAHEDRWWCTAFHQPLHRLHDDRIGDGEAGNRRE